MNDQAVLLPKWSLDWRIIFAKYQLDYLYTFRTMSILISPVQIIMRQPLCRHGLITESVFIFVDTLQKNVLKFTTEKDYRKSREIATLGNVVKTSWLIYQSAECPAWTNDGSASTHPVLCTTKDLKRFKRRQQNKSCSSQKEILKFC